MDFSIIIPAKNEEENIGRCLDSIDAMDFEPDRFEVLVIDNGSSDRTVEIAETKSARVFEKPDLTISGLRNFGASQAKGRILAFLDADCTVAANWLKEAARYLGNTQVACFGAPPGIPEGARWVQKTWFMLRQKRSVVEDVQWLESMNMFVPRQTFAAVGGFNEKLVTCEDYDLSLRLQPEGKIIADSRIVAIHHGEAASLRHFFRKEYWRASSNIQGIKSHVFNWKEVPSLALPPVYLLLTVATMGCLLVLISPGATSIGGFFVLLLIWQVPIALFAAWKTHSPRTIRMIAQLHVLLNVYFLSRGIAFFGSLICRIR